MNYSSVPRWMTPLVDAPPFYTRRRLIQLCKSGRVPAMRFGRDWLIDVDLLVVHYVTMQLKGKRRHARQNK